MISKLENVQNRFHKVLDLFINGALYTRETRIRYPYSNKINIDPIREDVHLLCDTFGFNSNGMHKLETIEELAYIISDIFKNLLNLILINSRKNEVYETISVYKKFSEKDYSRDRETRLICKLINNLSNKNFQSLIKSFYIHGSYSTMDYVRGISDLDTLIIIKDNTLLDYKKLLELHHICYQSTYYFNQIDPLQHHGYILLTEADLLFYPQNYFPVILFNYSTLVFGNRDVRISLRDNSKESEDIYLQTLKYLKENKPSDFKDIFHFKLYFQVLQLLPIAFFQRKNVNLYKRYSFDEFYKYFPESRSLFAICGNLRNNWKVRTFKLDVIGEIILYVTRNPNAILLANRMISMKTPKYITDIFNDVVHRSMILPLIEQMEGNEYEI